MLNDYDSVKILHKNLESSKFNSFLRIIKQKASSLIGASSLIPTFQFFIYDL